MNFIEEYITWIFLSFSFKDDIGQMTAPIVNAFS
jgi:hypothetical protein